MATITFLKRNKRTIMTMNSSSLRCISATITSSSYDNYYGRNSNTNSNSSINDRFNKNNFDVRYASSSSSSSSDNNYNNITIKEQQKFTYISQKGDTAGHMVGSSIEKPIRKNKEHVVIKRYRNFTNQWLEETGHSWPSKCSTKGCSNKPNVGAHIFIRKKKNAYLVPMCSKCNMTPMKNFIPIETIDERSRFPIELDNETTCVELPHIHISKQTYIILDRSTWLEMLKRFFAYSKKHNSPLVPKKYKHDQKLGQWVQEQRRRYKSNTIPQYQVELLEANGFVWDALKYEWDKNILLLVKFKQREGHCNVPNNHKEDGKNLGYWLIRQRQNERNGRLDKVKEKQLEKLGFIWDPLKYEWDENIILLLKYKDREGHCNVPSRHKEDGANIGVWLNTQRQEERKGKLDTVKEKQLEELGVVWEPLSEQWNAWFTLLVKFKQREGHCNLPQSQKEDKQSLGEWLKRQRQDERNGKLDTVKAKQLEELGVVWEPLSEQWEEMYTLLAKYKQREGHCDVLWNHEEEGKTLGRWVYEQRYNKRNGKLNEDRQHRLEEIGIIFLMFPGTE